jgi:ABC-2 type transport system ATP-binding protein
LLALDTVSNLIARYGGKDVVIAEQRDQEIRIETEDPMRELEKLHKDGQLVRFRVERPTLESVFLNLTGRQLRD